MLEEIHREEDEAAAKKKAEAPEVHAIKIGTWGKGHDGRARRPTDRRAETTNMERFPKRHLQLLKEEFVDDGGRQLPATRAECVGGERPCPFVSCRHHLFLDVDGVNGSIKINFPDREPEELKHSCSLDIADDGDRTLEEIGVVMNITRERVRQVEANINHKIGIRLRRMGFKVSDLLLNAV